MRERLPALGKSVLRGVGDDAAWLKTASQTLVTCDLLIENVHFLPQLTPPRLLGRKALSVNLSDIAAMAGIPDFAILGLGFPREIELEYADELLEGFLEVAAENKVELIGGDTTAAPVLTIAVTVLGRALNKRPVLRSGAKAGDEVWVTGTVGDAGLGFELLKKSLNQEQEISELHYSSLAVRHLNPTPRLEAGQKLAAIANAMVDVSDGIVSDLTRILEESSRKTPLRGRLFLERIPLSRDFRKYFEDKPWQSKNGLALALTGGEDYELLFTAPPKKRRLIAKLADELGLAFSRIGKIEKARKIEIILQHENGKTLPLPKPWFEHFPKTESTPN